MREAILNQKEVLTVSDLMTLYSLQVTRARQLMRELKHEKDRFKLKGKIHIEDYKMALKLKDKKSWRPEILEKSEVLHGNN